MRIALIQSDEREEGNSLQVARALRGRGHQVTLVTPQLAASPGTPTFVDQWRAERFGWLPVSAARLEPSWIHFPQDYGLATARRLSDVLIAFDAAWFFERHWAMPALRARRFRQRLLPLIVLDSEPDPELLPSSLEQINRAHSSRYALQWADAVCSGQAGQAERSVRRLEELWQERTTAPKREIRPAVTAPAVTVCIPYFEAPAWLPETLRSLEQQTSKDFTVVAVDDGTYSEEGRRGFDACAERYTGRGWKFVRQANQYPGAARNRAAREATTEFLLFLDSDDIAMPQMVARFLRAALLTGDDCLVVPNYGFVQQHEGPCTLFYDPPGNSLIGSMADDMHGGSCILVRREAFWSVDGFTEIRGVGFEDYEFHVRCNLRGLRWDVLPEFNYRYRMREGGSVSKSTPVYQNHARVRRQYEERLRGTGLEQLPLALGAAYQSNLRADEQAYLVRRGSPGPPKRHPASQRMRLLLLTCYFPFEMTSGWHKRAQELIRYFGSRYELTLVAPMTPHDSRNIGRRWFRYLHLVRGAEWSPPNSTLDLPFRVRERYQDSVRAALHAMPTEQYHAAIIDQIFMAEFRHDIQTTAILIEQNIESRLLRHAAAYSGNTPLPELFRNPMIEAERLEQYENRTWSDFPLRAVTSEVDRAQMDARCRKGKTVVAANGADLSDWLEGARPERGTVLFAAHLQYFPNIDAVKFLLAEIWPEVRRRRPRARLLIAGREPADTLKAMAAAAQGVEIIASPKVMARVAKRASISIVPLRLGSGTRIKILESMAWGLPVVSTTLGCEGIEAFDGEHLLLRDDPKEFAEAIVRLMSDPALWRKLREAGRELVRERYSWDRVFEPLEEALIELVS